MLRMCGAIDAELCRRPILTSVAAVNDDVTCICPSDCLPLCTLVCECGCTRR